MKKSSKTIIVAALLSASAAGAIIFRDNIAEIYNELFQTISVYGPPSDASSDIGFAYTREDLLKCGLTPETIDEIELKIKESEETRDIDDSSQLTKKNDTQQGDEIT